MAVGEESGLGLPGQVTLLSTPMYSNTTLGIFVATMAYGGTAVVMRKFDCARWLELPPKTPRKPHDSGAGAVPTLDGLPSV